MREEFHDAMGSWQRGRACYRSAVVRLLWFGLLALTLEIGWLVLWPLSAALSHSAAFSGTSHGVTGNGRDMSQNAAARNSSPPRRRHS